MTWVYESDAINYWRKFIFRVTMNKKETVYFLDYILVD